MIDRIKELYDSINSMECYECGLTKSINHFSKREIDRKAKRCLDCFNISDNYGDKYR